MRGLFSNHLRDDMLHLIGLIFWIALPGFLIRQLDRSGLPRIALASLILGALLIILASAMQAISAGDSTPDSIHARYFLNPGQDGALNFGLLYIAISGAAFVSFDQGSPPRKLAFSIGFWTAHIGLGLLLSLGFASPISLPAADGSTSGWLAQMTDLNTVAAAATLLGLLVIALTFILSLASALTGKRSA